MTALATLPHATRRRSAREIDGHIEFTFNDIHELCAFVAREISMTKLKYTKFAEKTGCCTSTVSRMANGYTQHPRAETVFQMLRTLGYEVVVRS
jgi:hypothetical protein